MTDNQFYIDKLNREIASLRTRVDELTAVLRTVRRHVDGSLAAAIDAALANRTSRLRIW